MLSRRSPGQLLKSGAKFLALTGGIFVSIEVATGNERFYREHIMPNVHLLTDAETAHRIGVFLAQRKMFPVWSRSSHEYAELETELFGRKLSNPIGLAAGFDKNGQAIEGLMERSGFGFVEIGSITPLPQPGNPMPRVFRLEKDEAVINRYGFNSLGYAIVHPRIAEYSSKRWAKEWAARDDSTEQESNDSSGELAEVSLGGRLLGVNLGKNKLDDNWITGYGDGVALFGPVADYIVINVSSPNTPGLRELQGKKELQQLLKTIKATMAKQELSTPLVLKVSPDLSHDAQKDIASICIDKRQYGISALIVSNTTTSRPTSLLSSNSKQTGGLSGSPLRDLSTRCIRDFYELTHGTVPIIGCGGISNGADAFEKIKAGASAVQLYTALIYQGWPVVGRVKRELRDLLISSGYHNVGEAVGADSKSEK